MAVKKGHEIATIDVELVTVSLPDSSDELGLVTASQINVDPQIETTEAIKHIVKGVLIAQKRQVDTLTGNTLTLQDNVFNPELVKIIQGGKIEYDEEGNFKKYTPPVVGEEYKPVSFTMRVYSGHYDASGLVIDHEMTTYPNCTGVPISLASQDDVFRAPQYTIISAPGDGEAPYEIEMVKDLPKVANADWMAEAAAYQARNLNKSKFIESPEDQE